MTREERSEHWRRIIEQQEASGLSGAAFCREHHINLHAFYRWRRRFRIDVDPQGGPHPPGQKPPHRAGPGL
ncbi:MAG: transposase [Deltaproteobacteria bacterium]|nr:transposase [Deltaproteobacteria bacterium]